MHSLTTGTVPLRAVLLASSVLIAAALPAAAQDATWLLNPGSHDFNTAANWTPATVPGGTAFFGTSNVTSLTFSATNVPIGGWTFNAGASNYNFTTTVNTLRFVGAGIVINGGSASIANDGIIVFQNTSSAGGVSVVSDGGGIDFFNTSTAGTANITNEGFGVITFHDTSTAGSATIANGSGNPAVNPAGEIDFENSSTAGNATIVNTSFLKFFNTSTAGNATITNNNLFDIHIDFFNSSTAGSATLNNSGINVNIDFNDTSTGGSAIINNNNLAIITFHDKSTAGSATITNAGEATINFRDLSTAGSATFTNGPVSGIDFFDGSTAGSATITNNGVVNFFGTSTAGSATIANSGNDAAIAFLDTSTAGNANITNSGINADINFEISSTAGSASITNDSLIDFHNASTAGSATITNNGLGTVNFHDTSTAGGASFANLGGIINFHDASTAGGASFINNTGGIINFLDTSTAGSASFTNNNLGTIDFHNASAAGSASFTNNSGGIVNFLDTSTAGGATIASLGVIVFHNTSTAGTAGITSSGGSINFLDASTAGSATVTADNGGKVFFLNGSTGGNARFVTNAGGVFDMSQLTSGGMTAGSIEGAGSYFLGANTLTVGSNGLSTTVSGVISDGGVGGGTGGGLTQAGSATLTLSAINTYTGATNVDGGTLVVNGSIATSFLTTVNSGGTLTGTGTVGNTSVAAGGIFVPGSGTPGSSMTATGNLNLASGSSYIVALNPTATSFANVSGTATLGGATVNANFAAGSYAFKQYTILNAGSVSGTFAPAIVNSNLPNGFADNLSYDATHAFLNLVLAPVAGPLNINQQNVDNGLLNSFNVNGGIPITLAGLTPAGLTQLSGEVGASFPQVAFQAGNSFLNLMLNPFFHGQSNGNGGAGAIGYADEKPKVATSAFASVDRNQAPSFDSRYSFWGGAYGGSGSIDGNAPTGSHDTGSQVYGFAAGLDYRATPDTTFGFALGGGGTHWSLDQGLGSGRSDMFQAGLYGKTLWGPAYLAGGLAYSFHDVTTNRTVTVAGTGMLQARFIGNVFSGRLEGGYRYAMPWAGVTPYGAVQVQSLALPSYNESATSGSSQFALSYASQAVTTTRTELGARFDKTWVLSQETLVTLYSRVAWAHDSGNTASASAIFQALPASNFIVYGAQPMANGALVTAGAEYKLDNGWSVGAKFDGEFSNTTALYSGSGTIRKVW